MWFANIGNESKELTEQGYFVVGTASDSLPSKGTSTYKGGMTGYFVSKETGSESFYLGDSKLEVDFAAQNIKGGISNMEDADSNSFGTNVDIVDGKLTSDGFTGKLKYSNGAAVTSSSIAGNFYGSDAPELGGVGQVENDTTILSFGFTAKK